MLKNRVSKFMACALAGVMTLSAPFSNVYASEEIEMPQEVSDEAVEESTEDTSGNTFIPLEDSESEEADASKEEAAPEADSADESLEVVSEETEEDKEESKEETKEPSVSDTENDLQENTTEESSVEEEIKEETQDKEDDAPKTQEEEQEHENSEETMEADTNEASDETPQSEEPEIVTEEPEKAPEISDEKEIENKASADEEETADEETLTERELSENAGGNIVKAYGLIPEEATLSVKEVTYVEQIEDSTLTDSLEGSFKVIEAYDIELILGDETWQPVEHGSIVTISVEGVELPEEAEDIKVIRIEDDNKGITELSSSVSDNTVTFETEHFTLFTIGSTTYETDEAASSFDISKNGDGSVMAYFYEADKKLVITGSGSTKDYGYFDKTPFLTLTNEEYEVVISDDVTRIGNYLFKNCDMAKITALPTSLKEVGEGAFSSCENLYIDTLPSGMEKIEKYAFSYCKNLTISTIPDSVTLIGDFAFSYCEGITISTIPSGITAVGKESYGNCYGITELVIPEGVTAIGVSSFEYCSNLKKVTFSGTVTSIGERAFYRCNELEEISGGNNVETIGDEAFYVTTVSDGKPVTTILNTTSDVLNSHDWSADNRKIWEPIENNSGIDLTGIDPVDISKDQDKSVLAYYKADSNGDKLVILGSGDTYDYAYYEPSPISENHKDDTFELIIAGQITSLGSYLFDECSHMTLSSIPESVKTIGDSAFDTCESMDPVFNEGLVSIGYGAFRECKALSTTKLPDTLSSIGEVSFNNCTNLSLQSLPQNITAIPDAAFSDCKNLKIERIEDSVTSIGDGAFLNCGGMNLTYLSRNITSIGYMAFYGCAAMTIDHLPEALSAIESDAFAYCNNITISKIPEGVTVIPTNAFYGCGGIKELTLPESLITIDYEAFFGCNNLTVITGGNNVTEVGYEAFYVTGDDVYTNHELITKLNTSSETLNNYDWLSDNRKIGINGSFKVVLPASMTLNYDGESFKGSTVIKVETDGLSSGEAVYVEAGTGYVTGDEGIAYFEMNQSKTRWVKGETEDATLDVTCERYYEMHTPYEGEISITIRAEKE